MLEVPSVLAIFGLSAIGAFGLICAIILIFAGNFREDSLIAFGGVALIAIVIFLNYGSNPFKYIIQNPITSISVIIGFFILGAMWATWRWLGIGGYAWKVRRRFDEELKNYLNDYCKGAETVPDEKLLEWVHYRNIRRLYPYASDNKARITNWIITWPVDFLVWMIGDFIVEISKFVYRRIANSLDAFTKKYVFKDVDERLLK